MKTLLFLSSLIFYSLSIVANDLPPSAKVIVLRGEAFLDGVAIKENQIIDKPGKITMKNHLSKSSLKNGAII